MSESESSYNEDGSGYYDEDEYEESEEIVLEEELPHEEDEYTESDSYEYPYPTSSDDSWAELSSDEAIQKIIEKLPTYSSESSGDDVISEKPPLHPASDSDAGSFIEHNDEKNDYNYNYDPDLYLKSVETYQLYIVSHTDDDSDDDNDDNDDDIITPTPTPNDTIIQGQAQEDQPEIISDNNNNNNNIEIISEDKAIEYKQNDIEIVRSGSATNKINKYRGRDKPRRMTKTRIVIKKVAAKRGPKRFKMDMKVCIKNNKEYEGVIGMIRYVGIILDNKMVGIEIFDDSIIGNTDGIYKGNNIRYFECLENKGLFLPIKQVKKYINSDNRKKSNEFMKAARERRRFQRNNAQMYGNVVDILWKERIDLIKQKKYRIIHKAGPRDAGRIEYFGGDDEFPSVLNDPTHWLEPRLKLPKRKDNEKPIEPKLGPRDIGRKDSFVGIKYEIGEEEEIRAKKKAILEAKKKKEWEEARKKKLEEGKITRAQYPHVQKIKKKKDIKKKNIKKDKKDKKDKKKLNKKNELKPKKGSKKKSKSALPISNKSKKKLKLDKKKEKTKNGTKPNKIKIKPKTKPKIRPKTPQ